jgi:hypothetical protein
VDIDPLIWLCFEHASVMGDVHHNLVPNDFPKREIDYWGLSLRGNVD